MVCVSFGFGKASSSSPAVASAPACLPPAPFLFLSAAASGTPPAPFLFPLWVDGWAGTRVDGRKGGDTRRVCGVRVSGCTFPSHGAHSLAFTAFSLHWFCLPTNRKRGNNKLLILCFFVHTHDLSWLEFEF